MESTFDATISGSLLSGTEISTFQEMITPESIKDDIRQYSSLFSRHVRHPDNEKAVLMATKQLGEAGGASFDISTPEISLVLGGSTPKRHNIEAKLTGLQSGEVVIISAHIDSTAAERSGYRPLDDEAPGADDDGSGIAGVLAAARALAKLSGLSKRVHREIRFVLFNAEELNRVGSIQYTKHLRTLIPAQSGKRDAAAFQMDMIAHKHRWPQTFEIHAGFSDAAQTGLSPAAKAEVQRRSIELAQIVARMAQEVSPCLCPEIYPRGSESDNATSDQISFHEQRFAACLIMEDYYPSAEAPNSHEPNPGWHRPSDTMDKLNFEYAAHIARAVAAAAWYRATR